MRFWLTNFVGQTPRKVLVIDAQKLKDHDLQLGGHEVLKSALQALITPAYSQLAGLDTSCALGTCHARYANCSGYPQVRTLIH